MAESDDPYAARSIRTYVALAVALVFVAVLSFDFGRRISLELVVTLGQGFAVAIYTLVMMWGRIDRDGKILATSVIVLGATHLFWAPAISLALGPLLAWASVWKVPDLRWSLLFLVTGLVFGAVFFAATRSKLVGGIMLLATTLSVLVTLTESRTGWTLPAINPVGIAALPLHTGIVLSLFIDARRALRRDRQHLARCRHCGYDLTGLQSSICPECGTSVANPAPTTTVQTP